MAARIFSNLFLILAAAWVLSGCSTIGGWFSSEEDPNPPAELIPVSEPHPIDVLWSRNTGSGVGEFRLALRPLVHEGAVYTADYKGVVAAWDIEGGKSLWQQKSKLELSAGPGIGDGLIVVGSSDGDVLALDLSTGEEIWRLSIGSEVLAVPLIDQGMVFVRTVDGRVSAFDAGSGDLLWRYQQDVPVLTLRGVGQPLLVQDWLIVPYANGRLIALDIASGAEVWNRRLAEPKGRSELERIVDLDASPAYADGIVYAGGYQGNLSGVIAESGIVLWDREMSSHRPVYTDRYFLFISDDASQVWALDVENGASLWRQDELLNRRLTGPVRHGDMVAVGDFEGYLHWLAFDDGRVLARRKIDSDGIDTTPLVVDGVLYVYGNSGTLAAIRIPEPSP